MSMRDIAKQWLNDVLLQVVAVGSTLEQPALARNTA